MTDDLLIWHFKCPECGTPQGHPLPEPGDEVACLNDDCEFAETVEEVEVDS